METPTMPPSRYDQQQTGVKEDSTVTEEMVERAAHAMWRAEVEAGRACCLDCFPDQQEAKQTMARAGLAAALIDNDAH